MSKQTSSNHAMAHAHLYRSLDENLMYAVHVALQRVVPHPAGNEHTYPRPRHEDELVWRQARLAALKHLRCGALHPGAQVAKHAHVQIEALLLEKTVPWLDEMTQDEQQRLDDIASFV